MLSIKKFWGEYKFIFYLFLLWRTELFLVGLWAFRWTFKASFPLIDEMLIGSGFPQWFWHWGNFDGVHYLDLAKNGYHGSGLQVFFPLYPLAIKFITVITKNFFLSGFLISHFSILISAIFLYALVKREFNVGIARWSVLFLFLFPTSYYFGTIYTESLFLLLVLASFYFRKTWAGIFAVLAGATRLTGVFIPWALVLLRPRNWWGLLGLFGIAGYMLYLQLVFGNPVYFFSAQAAFRNERAYSLTNLVTPPQVVIRYFKIFATADPTQPAFWTSVLEFSAFVFGLVLLLWLTLKRKVPWPYLFYSWPAFLLPTFSGTFSSMPRYLLTVFPVYIGLALLPRIFRLIVLVVFGVLLLYLSALFTRGYWVA